MEEQGIPTFMVILASTVMLFAASVVAAILVWVLLTATLAPK